MPDSPPLDPRPAPPGHDAPPAVTRAFRRWLPLALVVVGAVLLVLGVTIDGAYVGVVLIVAAPLVAFANLFMRMSILSQDDRDEEAEARRTFAKTGHWPPDPHDHHDEPR